MSLTLSDALSHYRAVSDTTHKFWGYFQAIAAGTAAFAWSRDGQDNANVLVLLGFGFAVFAILNWRLVCGSQCEAMTAADCVKAYARRPDVEVPSDLLPIIQKIAPDRPVVVGFWHASLSIATLVAIWWRYDNRTHRKLLVVDGRIGFTGGVGIAPEWTGNAQDAEHWRDSHFKVEGPVVAQMQAVFMDNWIKASNEVLHGEKYFPALAPVGSGKAQVFSSSPSGGSESMHLMYLLSIAAATRSIDLASAYFVPDALTIQALVGAMQRGVRVRIITPGPIIDAQTVRAASRASWGPLLEAGAQISEYQPTMFHCKVFVVDQLLVSVGSTNFDNRSFRLNDEANLNIYDAKFAEAQTQQFEADLKRSKRVTLQAWQDRPLREKALERLASVLSAQL